jgi:purine-binding chemotaxis protein CheW
MSAPPALDLDERIQIATFAIGDELFGLDIMRIHEIVRPQPVTAIPGSPHGVTGVIRLRGVVLPVVDLRARFGLHAGEDAHDERRFVVATVDGRRVALVVDRVGDVATFARRDVRLARDTLSGASARFFVGIVSLNDKIVLLMHVRRVLADLARVDLGELTRVDEGGEVLSEGDGIATVMVDGDAPREPSSAPSDVREKVPGEP